MSKKRLDKIKRKENTQANNLTQEGRLVGITPGEASRTTELQRNLGIPSQVEIIKYTQDHNCSYREAEAILTRSFRERSH